MNVEIIPVEERVVYGLWVKSSDKTIPKDIKTLSDNYHKICSDKIPLFVLSRNYSKETKEFELFVGGVKKSDGLEGLILAEGNYAKITVSPKLGFLWGLSIGEAKRYFYQKWLPDSKYRGQNLEYEYHTEKTLGKHPTLDIIFAVENR